MSLLRGLRAPRREKKPRRPLVQGPWLGVRDNADATAADPRFLRDLVNCYLETPENGGRVRGRPGFTLTDAAAGEVQGFVRFRAPDGSVDLYRVKNGALQAFNWASSTWTLEVSHGTISALTPFSQTAQVALVPFAGMLIVSDGINRPWAWDGTSGSGVTALANCPPLYGPPTVYYGKLVGIKADDRRTLVWSEENDPTLGYDAVPYNNAWELTQSDQDALVAVRGTNTALYVWRLDSITTVLGAITPDFQSAGTHDNVSEAIGTGDPWSIIKAADSFYFVDALARPQRLMVGGGVVGDGDGRKPIWTDAAGQLSPLAQVPAAAFHADLQLVLLAYNEFNTNSYQLLAFHAPTGLYMGRWPTLGVIERLYATPDLEGRTALFHADNTPDATYRWDVAGAGVLGTVWSDNGNPINHAVRALLTHNPRVESAFHTIEPLLHVDDQISGMELDLTTPLGTTTMALVDVLDALAGAEQRIVAGIEETGRFLDLTLRHETEDEQFALLQLVADATPLAPFPDTP